MHGRSTAPRPAAAPAARRRSAPMLALGATPLADRLLTAAELDAPDVTAPLDRRACAATAASCRSAETVAPEVLFGADYPYFSSVSSTLLAHSRANALELIERLRPGRAARWWSRSRATTATCCATSSRAASRCSGIDPAEAPAAAAIARRRADAQRRSSAATSRAGCAPRASSADLILANNVLAHVADLNGFVEGIATLLHADGVAVLEMPYLADLIDHGEFDTIYHQHLCYFSVDRARPAVPPPRAVPATTSAGCRSTAARCASTSAEAADVQPAVRQPAAPRSAARGLDRLEGYRALRRAHAAALRERLTAAARGDSRPRAGGSPPTAPPPRPPPCSPTAASAATCSTTWSTATRSSRAASCPAAGCRSWRRSGCSTDRPDYVLLLPWNFADEILAAAGGVPGGAAAASSCPIPEPRIV